MKRLEDRELIFKVLKTIERECRFVGEECVVNTEYISTDSGVGLGDVLAIIEKVLASKQNVLSIISKDSAISGNGLTSHFLVIKVYKSGFEQCLQDLQDSLLVNKEFSCGKLKLSFKSATIQWADMEPVHISAWNDEVRLLGLLLENNPNVTTYEYIGKSLLLPSYDENPTDSDKASLHADIHKLRQKIRKLLSNIGLTKDEISSTIRTVNGVGYKIIG